MGVNTNRIFSIIFKRCNSNQCLKAEKANVLQISMDEVKGVTNELDRGTTKGN